MSDSVALTTQLSTTIPQIAGDSPNYRDPPCFPAGHSPMERMPNEILTKICGLVVPETKRVPEKKRAFAVTKRPSFEDTGIRALALTSKRMQPSAQRAMYNSIVLGDDEKSILLLRSLLQFPDNRELVRHLEVRPPVEVLHPTRANPFRFPERANPFRFVDMPLSKVLDTCKVLDTIYEGERCNPQLPRELLDDLKEELDPLTTETEWLLGRYPQGGFNTVTRAIIHLCPNIQSFKVQIMGEWSGSSCNYTLTNPRSLLAWPRQPAIAFNHLRILDLDVASITDFSMRDRKMFGCRVICPPTVADLTLRHEDASLSRNFLLPYLFNDRDDVDYSLPCLHDLFHFLMPCSSSLRKLRLMGGFDHAGLVEPSCLFTPQMVCDDNWNTILPYFQQLVHLEFDGYGNPCPPDDRYRNTWPDNVYRYGADKIIACLGQLPKLRYLKLPLVDLFPLSPGAFPDTAKGLRQLALQELSYDLDPDGFIYDPVVPHDYWRGFKRRMIQSMEGLAGTLDTGKGSHHNVREKLRQAAGGEEIPGSLEKVELYYFVEDTDKKKDPRERWAKSGQYASLDRVEIEFHEKFVADYEGWFPTKEKIFTWTRGY